jgi:hypothetical protein
MARQSPAQKIAWITKVSNAWEALAADTVFYGKTLAEFRSAVQPSYDARADIARLQGELAEAIRRRTRADERSIRLLRGIVFGVLADPDHDDDGPLYAAMGYVIRGARRRKPRRKAAR